MYNSTISIYSYITFANEFELKYWFHNGIYSKAGTNADNISRYIITLLQFSERCIALELVVLSDKLQYVTNREIHTKY